MTEPNQKPLEPARPTGLFPGLVIAVDDGRARVRSLSGQAEVAGARCAVIGYTPQTGDRVLVQAGDDGAAYLIGVLHTSAQPSLRAANGASAELREADSTLRLLDAHGQLVCEFDTGTGRLTVHAQRELQVTVPEGQLGLHAARLALTAEQLELRAKSFLADFGHAGWTAQRWELQAARLKERARDKFVEVEGTLHTRAGRVRSLVAQTWELLSQRTRMFSKENTSIDGEKILLG